MSVKTPPRRIPEGFEPDSHRSTGRCVIRPLHGAYQSLRVPGIAVLVIWSFTLLNGGLNFLAQIILARNWGAADYGAFMAALNTITLGAPIAGFGVAVLWLDIFGREGFKGTRWLPGSFQLVLASTTLVLACLLVWAAAAPDPSTRSVLLWLLPVLPLLLCTKLVQALFQLEGQDRKVGLLQAVPALGKLGAALAVLLFSASLLEGAATYAAVAVTVVLALAGSLRRLIRGEIHLKGHTRPVSSTSPADQPGLWRVLKEAWPFGLAGVSYLVLYQSDIILLGWLRSAEEAGQYAAAYTLVGALTILPGALYQKFLRPRIHRYAHHDRTRFLALFRIGGAAMALGGALAAVLIVLVGPTAIDFLFGADYGVASALIPWLGLTLPARFLGSAVGSALVTSRHMAIKVWIQLAAALVNVATNLVLIPLFGVFAAVGTTVACELLRTVMMGVAVHRNVLGLEAWTKWSLRLDSLQDIDEER